jgi:hypothetical protein
MGNINSQPMNHVATRYVAISKYTLSPSRFTYSLTFSHRASNIYSAGVPATAFYIFSQQIYLLIFLRHAA